MIKDGQASIDYAVNTVVKLVGNDKRRVWLLASPNGMVNKLVGLLKIHRYPVCVFDDFKALQAALNRETPDLLLLEGVEEIPKGDVFTFINGLRSRYTANQLPVIVCGSTAELPVAIKLMKYGVNDFYNTGFSAEELYVRLNQNLEQAEAYQRIERISQTDALTRLYNRGYFFQTGQSQLEGWQKQKLPAFVVMSDIDHFKSVNDTHGHQKGDEAITFVADQLQKTFKDHLVARFGGEEFCVLGVVDEPEALQGACEQFRHAIETGSENETGVPFTASVGVARVESHLEQAIYDADQALYRAKASGRNQVVVTSKF